jgi:hypothetical protein
MYLFQNEKDQKTFVIKPIPSASVKPVLVFINPKSGGNQGAKLLQKFQWLLNPRQVFDLTQGGPRMGYGFFISYLNMPEINCILSYQTMQLPVFHFKTCTNKLLLMHYSDMYI